MNADHLSVIKQGVEVWNAWKANNELNTIFYPDLSGADLRGQIYMRRISIPPI